MKQTLLIHQLSFNCLCTNVNVVQINISTQTTSFSWNSLNLMHGTGYYYFVVSLIWASPRQINRLILGVLEPLTLTSDEKQRKQRSVKIIDPNTKNSYKTKDSFQGSYTKVKPRNTLSHNKII